jgi:hypothetical protein
MVGRPDFMGRIEVPRLLLGFTGEHGWRGPGEAGVLAAPGLERTCTASYQVK